MNCKYCGKLYKTNGWLSKHEMSCATSNKLSNDQRRVNTEENNSEIISFSDELFESLNKFEYDIGFMDNFRKNKKISVSYLSSLKNNCQSNKVSCI